MTTETMASPLPWIVLLLPLIAAVTIVLSASRSRKGSSFISVAAVLGSFALSCIVFATPNIIAPEIPWLDLRPTLFVPLGLVLDQLSRTMLVLVSGVGAVIHVYSLGYMRGDEGKPRYFAGLSLFMFSMFGIVLANNFVMMFIFWELVGISSYLLIGHWFTRETAAAAANKAFITNRIGDFGFMLGILMAWSATGSVVFSEMEPMMPKLLSNPGFLTATALLIFCGAVGKSAQFPLHVWLPDAMEGPTPVSALIHAATMVAAGVYMLVRVSFLIQAAPDALHVIAWIGIITAVLAALMATQQDDIKRILAYSTLSQLGYMVMSVGLAAGELAMFHLFTHAFFKALLFLGAGSVIVMLHHEQNIWRMGGLAKRLSVTFLTFAIGTLALIGCPPFSGFFSKDALLGAAFAHDKLIFALALFTAFLTAFYMTRLVIVAFLGRPRTETAAHSREAPAVMIVPLVLLAVPAFIGGFGFFAERFLPIPDEHAPVAVPLLATTMMVAGAALGYILYNGKGQEPLDLRALRNRLYIDEFYRWLIRSTQERLARISALFDRWIIDAVGVTGASRGTMALGSLLRLLQVGNLQGYAFLLGLGVVALIYLAICY